MLLLNVICLEGWGGFNVQHIKTWIKHKVMFLVITSDSCSLEWDSPHPSLVSIGLVCPLDTLHLPQLNLLLRCSALCKMSYVVNGELKVLICFECVVLHRGPCAPYFPRTAMPQIGSSPFNLMYGLMLLVRCRHCSRALWWRCHPHAGTRCLAPFKVLHVQVSDSSERWVNPRLLLCL